jgi:hypothetical protein
VVDAVFADELLGPALVRLVDPHRALRQRHAHVVVLAVVDVQVDADLLVRDDLAVVAAVVVLRAPEDQLLLDADVMRLEQRHLLLLLVEQRGRSPERVQVVLEEALFWGFFVASLGPSVTVCSRNRCTSPPPA